MLYFLQVVVLSDVFTDKSQFDWMLTTLLDIYKSHPGEDELVTQYLIVGICKAAAVVGVVRNYIINYMHQYSITKCKLVILIIVSTTACTFIVV